MDMSQNDSKYKYTSSIWDQSFLLTIIALAATGLLYSLDHLLREDEPGDGQGQYDGDGDADDGGED